MPDPLAGAYMPLDTPVHRADPFLKLIIFLGLILAASLGGIPGKVFVLLAAAAAAVFSKTGFRELLRAMKGFAPFLVLILLMNGLLYRGEQVIWSKWFFCISGEGIRQGLSICAVMAELIILSAILRRTTTPLEITGAAVRLLSPLRVFGVRTGDLALILSTAVSFIPVLMEESQTVIRAQRARGAKINEGSLKQRIGSVFPLVIPIFLSAFRRADELSQALLARGYKED